MRRPLLVTALLLLAALGVAAWALLYTAWGLQKAYDLARRALPGELQVQALQGRLAGPLALRGLSYAAAGLRLELDAARLHWAPAALWRGRLRLTGLELEGLRVVLSGGDQPRSAPPALPTLALPLPLDIEGLRLADLRVQTAPGAPPAVLDRLALDAAWSGPRVRLRSLRVAAYDAELETRGELELSGRYALALSTRWRYAPPGLAALSGEGRLDGDLHRLELVQGLHGLLEARLDGRLEDLLDAPRWQARLGVERFAARQVHPDWPEVTAAGELRSRGRPEDFELEGELAGQVPAAGAARARVSVQVAGGLWTLRELVLDQPQGAASLQARGQWRPGGAFGRLQLSGHWRGLGWPLQGRAPRLSSPQGRFAVEGAPEDYAFSVAADLSAPELPGARLEAQGQGDLQGLRLPSLRLQVLEGAVEGSADLSWTPGLAGRAELTARGLDPSAHWPDWPGRLEGRLSLRLRQGAEGRRAELHIAELGGVLRGQPLAGGGRVRLEGERLDVEGLSLRAGAARLELSGSIAERWDLRGAASVPDLSALWPGACGGLQTQGRLSGPRLRPHATGSLQARELALAGLQVARLEARADADLAAQGPFSLSVEAEQATLAGRPWQRAALQASGTGGAHEIRLEAEAGREYLRAHLRAGMGEAGRWAGELSELTLDLAPWGPWRLRGPAAFALSPQEGALVAACLVQGAAELCLTGRRAAAGTVGELRGKSLPLALVGPWLPAGTGLAGRADIHARVSYDRAGRLQAEAEASVREGAVQPAGDEEPIGFGPARLILRIDDAGLRAELDLPLEAGGGLRARLALPGWEAPLAPADDQPLRGRLSLERLPLELVGRFLPEVARPEGELQGRFTLEGSLGEPRMAGEAVIGEGGVEIPALGIRLRELSARLQAADGVLQYTLSARSGEGRLSLEGHTRLAPAAGWPTRARLSGRDFLAADLPEARVLVSPELRMELSHRDLTVEGEVQVPRARLRPRGLPEGTATISRDVVIVGEGAEAPPQAPWQLHARLRVSLGEAVEFDGFGLRGRLVGSLLLIDEPGQLTRGQGEVGIVEGVYRTRGQELEIRRGRLVFADSPVDDPGLDMEAVRAVEEVTAGVRVRGTLRRPELTVFSEPAMSESDALAYLLLGRPLGQASTEEGRQMQQAAVAMGIVGGDLLAREVGGRLGLDELRVEAGESAAQTALVVGKYLSPRLYLRYVTGIVESSYLVQLRYQLSRRVQIQTEGGYRGSQSVTGGDIFYTIEY